jgi:hypothetical protein
MLLAGFAKIKGWLIAAGGLAVGAALLAAAVFGAGRDRERVSNQKKQLEQQDDFLGDVVDSVNAGEDVARELRNQPERLREPDRYKRKSRS